MFIIGAGAQASLAEWLRRQTQVGHMLISILLHGCEHGFEPRRTQLRFLCVPTLSRHPSMLLFCHVLFYFSLVSFPGINSVPYVQHARPDIVKHTMKTCCDVVTNDISTLFLLPKSSSSTPRLGKNIIILSA